MSAEFSIRVAGPEDEFWVSETLEASYSLLMPPSYEEDVLAVALPSMIRANPALLSAGTYYVAEATDGGLAGCGGWTPERPGSGEIEPKLSHIRHFATHPDWLGRNVGRSIYLRCEAEARAAGVDRFECYASLNSEKFYAALGFQRVRPVDVPMGDRLKFPAILMERSI